MLYFKKTDFAIDIITKKRKSDLYLKVIVNQAFFKRKINSSKLTKRNLFIFLSFIFKTLFCEIDLTFQI